MSYKETSETEDEESLGIPSGSDEDELSFDDNDSEDNDFVGEDDVALSLLEPSKKKSTPKTFSLQARRAIEDHLEQRRLRKELDYLFDDEFTNSEEVKK